MKNGERMLLLALGCLRRLATKLKSSVSSKWREFVEVAQIEAEAIEVGAGTDLAVDSSIFVHDDGNKSG